MSLQLTITENCNIADFVFLPRSGLLEPVNQRFFRIIVGKAVFPHYMVFWMLADKFIVASFDYSTIADVQVFGYLLLCLLDSKLGLDFIQWIFVHHVTPNCRFQ